MKQVNLTIAFDEEKLTALKRYMSKKELELESEMTDALTKLYEKYVPAPVREYIDESDAPTLAAPKPKRPAKSADAKSLAQAPVTPEVM